MSVPFDGSILNVEETLVVMRKAAFQTNNLGKLLVTVFCLPLKRWLFKIIYRLNDCEVILCFGSMAHRHTSLNMGPAKTLLH